MPILRFSKDLPKEPKEAEEQVSDRILPKDETFPTSKHPQLDYEFLQTQICLKNVLVFTIKIKI